MSEEAVDLRPLIVGKRRGRTLTPEEIERFVSAVHGGAASEAQAAALLMAAVTVGLDETEAASLTRSLVGSGRVLDLSGVGEPTIDKHSTGGVADTTTLVVVPLLAACGARVAKLSGRALGHTGGTIDKLEAIPGMDVDLGSDRLVHQVRNIGCAIAAATRDLAPADATLYALRDRTATVDDVALIAASVMSKKIAAGARHIVLDVKTGEGAFLAAPTEARALAQLCVSIAAANGRLATALITDMSRPLGPDAGDALEVRAAVRLLAGEDGGRLRELSLELAAAALELTGVGAEDARSRLTSALEDGRALARFADMVAAQGGDPRVAEDPDAVLPRAEVVRDWAPGEGTLAVRSCRGLGELVRGLAAHAPTAEAVAAAGLEFLVEDGQHVAAGQTAIRIHAPDDASADAAAALLSEHVTVGDAPPARPELVLDRLGPA